MFLKYVKFRSSEGTNTENIIGLRRDMCKENTNFDSLYFSILQ